MSSSEEGSSKKNDRFARLRPRLIAYSEHLSRYCRDARLANCFVCPTCPTYWPLNSIESNPDVVTKGHVVPDGIGGKATVLECADCNHRHGRKGDAALVERSRQQHFGKSLDNSIHAYMKVGDKRLPIRFSMSDTDGLLQVVDGVDAAYAERALDPLVRGDVDEIGLSFRMYADSLVFLGHLHTAHLAMFRAFGYEYRLSNAGWRCVSLLSEPAWPDDFPVLTRSSDRLIPLREGEVAVVRRDDKVAFCVCTAVRDGWSALTFLPDLETGEPPDFALSETGKAGRSLRLIFVGKHFGYFADADCRQPIGAARKVLQMVLQMPEKDG